MNRLRSPIAPREKTPRAETPDGLRLRLRNLTGHLAVDDRNVVAWYRLAPVAYNYLTRDEQERIFTDVILAGAGLVGRGEFHQRTLPRPFAPYEWAAARADYLETLGFAPPDPDLLAQRSQADQRYLGSVDLGEYETYLGVTVCDSPSWLEQIRDEHTAARLAAKVAEVDRVAARPGLAGTPVTPEERDWLIDRSCGLHLPPPTRLAGLDDMTATDLFTFTDGITVDPWPDEHDGRKRRRAPKAIPYYGWHNGQPVERWVATLSLGRHQSLNIPDQRQPWIAYAQQLPFPVEWSLRGIVLSPEEARKKLGKQIKLFREQAEQLHVESPPDPSLVIANEAAIRRQHEMSESTPERGCEARWVARLAVAGRTEEQVLERVEVVKEHYARYDMTIEHPQGQAALAREFIPGEPQASVAHTRITGLDFLAVALPTLSAKIGDDVGPYRGYTAGLVRHRFMWDTHVALIGGGEAPGLLPVLGEPGAGKSTLFGQVADEAIVASVPTTIIQMAGSLERMARLPHLRGKCSVFDVRTARPGALNPYVVIPDPIREHLFQHPKVISKPEWEKPELVDAIHSKLVTQAERARGDLAFDDLWHLLTPAEQTSHAERTITRAVKIAPRDRNGSLDQVVEAMRDLDEDLAERFHDLGQLHACSLIFRPGAADAYDETATGVFLSMAGLDLPDPGKPPRTRAQRLNMPLFHNAVHLAARRVYELPPLTPKLFIGDELGLSAGWESGQALFTRLGADARKLRLRVMLGAQSPDWILRLDVDSLVDDVFVGRSHTRMAEKCLSLLQLENEPAFVRELTGLSPRRPDGTRGPREFLARLNGKVERVVIDLAHRPELLAALTPGAAIPGDLEEAA